MREPGEPPSHNLGPEGAAGHSVWWHWTAPSDGWASISTVGSTFHTVMAIYTGNTVDNLRLVEGNWSYGKPPAVIVTFRTTAGTTYQIAVDGFPGSWGDIQLNFFIGSQEFRVYSSPYEVDWTPDTPGSTG